MSECLCMCMHAIVRKNVSLQRFTVHQQRLPGCDADVNTHSLAGLLTYLLITCLLPRSPPRPPTHSLTHPLTQTADPPVTTVTSRFSNKYMPHACMPYICTHSLTHTPTYALLTHPSTHTTHSLTHSLTDSLTHSLVTHL